MIKRGARSSPCREALEAGVVQEAPKRRILNHPNP